MPSECNYSRIKERTDRCTDQCTDPVRKHKLMIDDQNTGVLVEMSTLVFFCVLIEDWIITIDYFT